MQFKVFLCQLVSCMYCLVCTCHNLYVGNLGGFLLYEFWLCVVCLLAFVSDLLLQLPMFRGVLSNSFTRLRRPWLLEDSLVVAYVITDCAYVLFVFSCYRTSKGSPLKTVIIDDVSKADWWLSVLCRPMHASLVCHSCLPVCIWSMPLVDHWLIYPCPVVSTLAAYSVCDPVL